MAVFGFGDLKPFKTSPTFSSEGVHTSWPKSFWSQIKIEDVDEDHAPVQSNNDPCSTLTFDCFLLAEQVSLYSVFTAYFELFSRAKILLQKWDLLTLFRIGSDSLIAIKKLFEQRKVRKTLNLILRRNYISCSTYLKALLSLSECCKRRKTWSNIGFKALPLNGGLARNEPVRVRK